MKWADANREIFNECIVEGNYQSAQAAIDDAKLMGIDTTDMEIILKAAKEEEKYS